MINNGDLKHHGRGYKLPSDKIYNLYKKTKLSLIPGKFNEIIFKMDDFSKWTIEEVEETFHLVLQKYHEGLIAWMTPSISPSEAEEQQLTQLSEKLLDHVWDWNEEELKVYFIIPLLNLVNFEQENVQPFLSRELSMTYQDEKITGILIKLDIPYASLDAIRLAEKISEYLDFHAKKTSMLLAKRRGAFPAFMNSKYTEPEWVKRKHCYRTGILAEEKWEELYHNIQEWGMRNASTTVFPPAGTSSKIANISTSFEPYFLLVHCQA